MSTCFTQPVLVAERCLGGDDAALVARGLQRLVSRPGQRHAGLADLLVAHGIAERVVLAMGLGQRAAQRIAALDPDQLLVRVVGEDQPALRVDDRDRGRDGVQHPAQQVLAGRGLASAQRLLEAGRPVGEHALLPAQGQQVAGTGAELEMVDRAQKEVGGTGLQRPIAELAVLIDGDDDDRDIVMLAALAQRAHEAGAVHLRHVVVGDDEVAGEPAVQGVQGFDWAGIGTDLQAFLDRQCKAGEYVTVGDAVVDDDYSGHSPLRRSRMSAKARQRAPLRELTALAATIK